MSTLSPVPATAADAPEVMVLQRACWVSEAITNNDLSIPPLSEPLESVRAWMPRAWVVRDQGRLIGAVRGFVDGDTWQIGRLMVAPDRQGEGLGGRLLRHVEAQAPDGVAWMVLFTGAASERNLGQYRRAGYVDFDTAPGLVFLRKPVAG